MTINLFKKITKNIKFRNIIFFLNFLFLTIIFFRSIYIWYKYFGHDDYGITEWLINYQGGFVRRGLVGEILFFIWNKFSIKANYLAIFLSSICYVFLLVYLIKKVKNKFPKELIISCVLMGMPIFSQFFVRKDILGIIFLIICLKILDLKLNKFLHFVFVNLVAILSLLSHEAFFFYAIVPLIFFYYNCKTNNKINFSNFIFSIFFFLPSIIIFVLIVLKSGDPQVGLIINNSWKDLWILIDPNNCCLDYPAATILSLEYSVTRQINITLEYWQNRYLNGIVWFLIIFICYFFLISFKYVRDINFSNILIFNFLCILPLYVVGHDWGRWTFYWTTSSLIFYLYKFNLKKIIFIKILNKVSHHIVYSKMMTCKKYWILIFFGVPVMMWTTLLGHFTSSPLGKYIAMFMKLFGFGLKNYT
jgi:hypothetical protein